MDVFNSDSSASDSREFRESVNRQLEARLGPIRPLDAPLDADRTRLNLGSTAAQPGSLVGDEYALVVGADTARPRSEACIGRTVGGPLMSRAVQHGELGSAAALESCLVRDAPVRSAKRTEAEYEFLPMLEPVSAAVRAAGADPLAGAAWLDTRRDAGDASQRRARAAREEYDAWWGKK